MVITTSPPVDRWHPSLLEEGAGGGDHRLVAAFNDAVLLRGVRRGEVALDPLVDVVRRELSRRELAAVVHAQHPKLAAALLRSSLVVLDGVRGCPLGVEEDSPHIAGRVVDEEEVASSSRCSGCHGATKVAMHEL